MKQKTLLFIFLSFISVMPVEAAYHSFDYAAGEKAGKPIDKTKLEGWIERVDHSRGRFKLMDPRGFERSVRVRPGTIADYRRGDHVRVTLDTEREWMSTIEKI